MTDLLPHGIRMKNKHFYMDDFTNPHFICSFFNSLRAA